MQADHPSSPVPKPSWPDHLKDCRAIAEYVNDHAVGDIDTQMVEECFFGCAAVLRWVPLGEIKEGSPDGNNRVPSREKKYKKLPLETMPPLLIDDGEIQDGNHRYRVAKALRATALLCYDVISEEDLDAELRQLRGAAPKKKALARGPG